MRPAGLQQGGYRIYMNVDTKLQKIVEEKFLDWADIFTKSAVSK